MLKKGFIIPMLLPLFFFIGCSTQKNTGLTRGYHNLTAHYNVHFNGTESLRQGVERIKTNTRENYSQILPMFQYGNEESARSASSDMDRTIEKSSKLIRKHSITVKPERKKKKLTDKEKAFMAKSEYCKWIDDGYLLMGIAHFYKREYFDARRAFEYVIQRFPDDETIYQARLWLARTYMQEENFPKALTTLDQTRGSQNLPTKYKRELTRLQTDYLLRQSEYKDAIPKLNVVIEQTRRKKDRARYWFILAQVYQELENFTEATRCYEEVIRLKPDYELAFNAKINIATTYSGGGSEYILRQLEKMLRDEKNSDYRDQIYYAIANINMTENKLPEAKQYYRLSSESSVSNKNQKALSCLALADIYFNEHDYPMAQAYFDSTILNLDRSFPDYDEIFVKARNLTALVSQMQIIEREDSLQRVARMPEAERMNFIDQIIEEVKRKEEEEKKKYEAGGNLDPFFDNDNYSESRSNSSLPFFNPTTLSKGMMLFKQKWGNRKLEDHWRRSNKAVLPSNEDENLANNEDEKKKLDNKSRDYYMVDLPLSDSSLHVSHKRIKLAIFRLGEIYREQIADYPKSIESFEELNKRYPAHDSLLYSYYHLYQLYNLINQEDKANTYRDRIVQEFPESTHAKVFSNPYYLQELNAQKKIVEEIYLAAYTDFKAKNYAQVRQRVEQVEKDYPDNLYMPRFKYLEALSIGAMNAPDVTELKEALKNVIFKYPESPVKVSAEEILTVIDEKSEEGNYVSKEVDLYLATPTSPHCFVMAVQSPGKDLNLIEFNLTKFNINTYSSLFEISRTELKKGITLVVVKGLKSKNEALEYIGKVIEHKELYAELKPTDYTQFVISEPNYEELIKDKNLNRYMTFYQANY